MFYFPALPLPRRSPPLSHGSLPEPLHRRQRLPLRGGRAPTHGRLLQRALCPAVPRLHGGDLPSPCGRHLPRAHPQHLPAAERCGIRGSPRSWSRCRSRCWRCFWCCPNPWSFPSLWWGQVEPGVPSWELQTLLLKPGSGCWKTVTSRTRIHG